MLRFRDAAGKVQRRRAKGYKGSQALLDRLCIPRHKYLETVLGRLESEGSAASLRKRGRDDEDTGPTIDAKDSGLPKRPRGMAVGGQI